MLERVAFAPVDRPIAERFGDLKADLRRRGITKSDADVLIAATALHLGAIFKCAVREDAELLRRVEQRAEVFLVPDFI